MVAQRDGLLVIAGGVLALYLAWPHVASCRCARREGDEEEEVRRELRRSRAQAWLMTSRIGFGMNLALGCLCLLLLAAEGRPEYGWAAVPCGATGCFCLLSLIILSRRGSRVRPGLEDGSGHDLGGRVSTYATLAALLAVVSLVHPSPLQGLLLGLQRLVFGVASLCPSEVAAFGLVASGARLAACHYVDGYEGACGEDPVAPEASLVLGTVLATYAATEMCKLLIRARVQQQRKESGTAEQRYSVDASTEQGPSSAFGESEALRSLLQVTSDATVFLDAGLRVSRPSPGLAMMLGFVTAESVVGVALSDLLVGEESGVDAFLEVLRGSGSEPGGGPALVALLSMVHTSGAQVDVHCAYTRIAGEHGSAAPVYVLGLREVCAEEETAGIVSPVPHSASNRSQGSIARTTRNSMRSEGSVASRRSPMDRPPELHRSLSSFSSRQASPSHHMARTASARVAHFQSVGPMATDTTRSTRPRTHGLPMSQRSSRPRPFVQRSITIDAVINLTTDAIRDKEPDLP